MKKTIAFTIAIVLGAAGLQAQSPSGQGEVSLVNVVYDFYHVNDLNDRSKVSHQEMILSIGKTWSSYQSFEDIKAGIRTRKALENMMASGRIRSGGAVRGGMVVNAYSNDRVRTNYCQNISTKELHLLESIGRNAYLVKSALPEIKWEVKNEKKDLGGLEVQRADGSYAGRKYTAWFSTDLPFSNGPWKLSGLPGLILEAEDETGEVKFIFKEIFKDEEATKIRYDGSAADLIVADARQVERLKATFRNDPIGTVASQGVSNVNESHIRYVDEDGNRVSGAAAMEKIREQNAKRKRRKDNPLELTK